MADRWAASRDGVDDLWADSPSPVARSSRNGTSSSKRGSRSRRSRRRSRADREGSARTSAAANTNDDDSAAASAENVAPARLNAAADTDTTASVRKAKPGIGRRSTGSNSSSSDDDGGDDKDNKEEDADSSLEYVPIRRPSASAGTKSARGRSTNKSKPKSKSRGIEPSQFHRSVMGDDDQAGEDDDDDDDNDNANDESSPQGALAATATAESGISNLRSRPPRPTTTPKPPHAAVGASSPPPTSLDRLRQILSEAQMRLVQNRRRDVTTQLKIRRAAFRDVTELRTWPLQELALDDLDRLLGVHLGDDDGGGGGGGGAAATMKVETANGGDLLCSSSGFASDSSGVSTSSIEEPKRACRRSGGGGGGGGPGVGRNVGGRPSLDPGEDLSPGKATLRARYAEEFRFERSLRRGGLGGKADGNGGGKDTSTREAEGKQVDGGQELPATTEVGVYKANADAWKPRRNEPDLTPDSICSASTSDEIADDSPLGPQPEDFLPALWCMEPRIFAVEKSAAGKRRYLVGHLGRFLDLYWRKSDSHRRHYYELIREGTPCRLYLDLEFTRAPNAEINDDIAEQLMTELIGELCLSLKQVYDLDVDRSAFVDLDSCTAKKFSRHLIVHLPRQSLFVDAPAVGSFIRHVVGRLAEEIATGVLQHRRPVLAKHLFVHTKEKDTASGVNIDEDLSKTTSQVGFTDDTTCFIDIGVYTRNRLFRLLGSTKYGKPSSAALRIASANTFPFPRGFANDRFYVPDQEQVTGGSTNAKKDSSSPIASPPDLDVDYDDEVDMGDPEIAQFFSSLDWSAHADALAMTLVVPPNYSKINYPLLQAVEEAPDVSRSGRVVTASNGNGSTNNGSRRAARSFPKSSVGSSPFLALDDFILHVLGSRGGTCGSIRAWSLDDSQPNSSTPSYITYHMKDNRFCERIRRQHKSNNVMWTVDLRYMVCHQTCHDPECRAMGFRGEPVVLPHNVQEQVRERLFDYELAFLDEQAILDKARNEEPAPSAATSTNIGEEISDSFEKALLDLNLASDENEHSERKDVDGATNGLSDPPNAVEGNQNDFDSALNAALMLNPELFP